MKFSFELARSVPASAKNITGASLKSPFPLEALRVPAQAVRDYQEFRHLAEKMNRSFEAASTDNYNLDLRGTYGSANTEIMPYRYTVRNRGRTMTKDTAHGRGLNRTYADSVVGDDPFELEMELGDLDGDNDLTAENKVADAIETAWKRYCRKGNFTVRKNMSALEAYRVIEMARMHPGSIIVRLYEGFPHNEFKFAVDLLEEDRLQETYQGRSPQDGMFGEGNPIRGSIEYHPEYNFPLAYWLLRKHPGEFFSQGAVLSDGKNFRVQIPASEIIYFNNMRTRPEQDSGFTELDATMLPLWRIHQYDKSLTLSSIASASKPWWIEQKEPTGFTMPSDPATVFAPNGDAMPGISPTGNAVSDPAQTQTGPNTPTNVVKPAAREMLPPGFTLKQADPRFPIEAAHEFRLDNLRDVAVATHGSYQQATNDYQNLGFMAALMSQQAFQRHMRCRQKTFAEDLLEWFRAWLRATIVSGYFDRRGVDVSIEKLDEYVDAARFKGQQFEFVNPLVQAQSLILLHQAKHLSRQDVQDALPNGKKMKKLLKQLKREQDDAESAGVTLDPEPEAGLAEGNDELDAGAKANDNKPKPDRKDSQPPAKKKTGTLKTRNLLRMKRGEIDQTTMALIQQSTNGVH